jgi:hypothetical protein
MTERPRGTAPAGDASRAATLLTGWLGRVAPGRRRPEPPADGIVTVADLVSARGLGPARSDGRRAAEQPDDPRSTDERPAAERAAGERPADDLPADERTAGERAADERPEDERAADRSAAVPVAGQRPAGRRDVDERGAEANGEHRASGPIGGGQGQDSSAADDPGVSDSDPDLEHPREVPARGRRTSGEPRVRSVVVPFDRDRRADRDQPRARPGGERDRPAVAGDDQIQSGGAEPDEPSGPVGRAGAPSDAAASEPSGPAAGTEGALAVEPEREAPRPSDPPAAEAPPDPPAGRAPSDPLMTAGLDHSAAAPPTGARRARTWMGRAGAAAVDPDSGPRDAAAPVELVEDLLPDPPATTGRKNPAVGSAPGRARIAWVGVEPDAAAKPAARDKALPPNPTEPPAAELVLPPWARVPAGPAARAAEKSAEKSAEKAAGKSTRKAAGKAAGKTGKATEEPDPAAATDRLVLRRPSLRPSLRPSPAPRRPQAAAAVPAPPRAPASPGTPAARPPNRFSVAPRPTVVDDLSITGITRRSRGKWGSLAFRWFFVLVFVVIVLQLIDSLLYPLYR